jgi:hypothetical protein
MGCVCGVPKTSQRLAFVKPVGCLDSRALGFSGARTGIGRLCNALHVFLSTAAHKRARMSSQRTKQDICCAGDVSKTHLAARRFHKFSSKLDGRSGRKKDEPSVWKSKKHTIGRQSRRKIAVGLNST